MMNTDNNAANRKKDHIVLAFESQVNAAVLDKRFFYEPLLAAHPSDSVKEFDFLGKKMLAPLWVSSMTGGTQLAQKINENLARVCQKYGFGMGLGSCRSLLDSQTYLKDFAVRKFIGDSLPLYANLGIAQIEYLLENQQVHKVSQLLDRLQADGLIIHINPFQEWLQPEGDLIRFSPLETIQKFLDKMPINVIVKEVGQGMGKYSLKALLELPLQAIDFAASGGTNFALLELLRSDDLYKKSYQNLTQVGHSAEEMIGFLNESLAELGDKVLCKQIIISGGIKDFLDGYYLTQKCPLPSIYGQASAFLQYATLSYEQLERYVGLQIKGFRLAEQFLRVRK